MYGKYALSLAAVLTVAGCSGSGGSESGDPPAQAARDSAATPAAGSARAMHDSTTVDSGAAHGMAGMDHSTMPGMDHSATVAGAPAGAAHSDEHGAAPAGPVGHAARGHSGVAGSGTAGANHAGMTHGGVTGTAQGPAGAHAGMNHGGAAGTRRTAATGGHDGPYARPGAGCRPRGHGARWAGFEQPCTA
jgi:hypothetical protein